MCISILPVLPPELRPIIRLKDNTIVTSDLNFAYKRIINNNNRIKQLFIMKVNEKYINKEKLLLQENMEELIGRKNNKRSYIKNLKTISETIKGKNGRIRENLLGKTVDFSARAVITVEPRLRLYQCGLPKEIFMK